MIEITRLMKCLLWIGLMLLPGALWAIEARIAVASNFTTAMKALASQYEADTGHRLTLIFGSTGKQYAQIVNGAPFDAFFAADSERPKRLEDADRGLRHSRFTYAIGRLVLWSPQTGYVDEQGAILANGQFRHLSIANPDLAPYGLAARQVLQNLGLWSQLEPRLVRGENIGQAFQFVRSGNAQLGFVAQSQLSSAPQAAGSSWLIPVSLHEPIDQQAVQLTKNPMASAFLAFVRGAAGRKIISEHGYDLPDVD